MPPAGVEPIFSLERDGLRQMIRPKIAFDLSTEVPRPVAWATALLIEALVVALLVFLARSESYSLPEPIPVGVILERPAPPPPAAAPPQPVAPDQTRNYTSSLTAKNGDKPVAPPQPQSGAADATPAETPPVPPPPAPAASAQIEPQARGRQSVPSAPVRTPVTTASTAPSRPKPAATRPQGQPIDLSHAEQGVTDAYLVALDQVLAEHRFYPEQARALGLTGAGIFEITLSRSGQVLEVRIAKSTGAQILDDAGTKIIRLSSPFPSVPAHIPGDPVRLYWTVNLAP